jgi:hypothetical protein
MPTLPGYRRTAWLNIEEKALSQPEPLLSDPRFAVLITLPIVAALELAHQHGSHPGTAHPAVPSSTRCNTIAATTSRAGRIAWRRRSSTPGRQLCRKVAEVGPQLRSYPRDRPRPDPSVQGQPSSAPNRQWTRAPHDEVDLYPSGPRSVPCRSRSFSPAGPAPTAQIAAVLAIHANCFATSPVVRGRGDP